MKTSIITLLIVGLLSFDTPQSDQNDKVIWSSFKKAKKMARNKIYKDHNITFYCGCEYTHSSTSGGKIDIEPCDYKVNTSEFKGKQLEWEHVVPASFFGNFLPCWTDGHPDCNKKGRNCCAKVNKEFHEAEVDLHNLVPSVGEINLARRDNPYGLVEGEIYIYGTCDFEVGGTPKRAEPKEEIRGDIARIWFYMIQEYDVPITQERLAMLREWDDADPVDDWERERNQRIKDVQGNLNPFVE